MPTLNEDSDNVVLRLKKKGDSAVITLAGNYDMTINLQREVGSPSSGAWETIKHWKKSDDKAVDVKYTHVAEGDSEGIRLTVSDWVSGSAEATLVDPLDDNNEPLVEKKVVKPEIVTKPTTKPFKPAPKPFDE